MTESPSRREAFSLPVFAAWFIHRFAPIRLGEGFSGDIEEEFQRIAEAEGSKAALRWTRRQALSAFRDYIRIRLQGSSDMFINYIKITFRNLLKNKLVAIINIVGLSLGIACAVLIYFFIWDEHSYDRFHANSDRLYRAYITEDPPQRDAFSYVEAPFQLGPAFENTLPEVESAVRLEVRSELIRYKERSFRQRIHLADSNFFKVFDFPLLEGDKNFALESAASVVLTRQTALKILGSTDIIGERISLRTGQNFSDFIVSAVAADPPSNSSIRFEALIPMVNVRLYHGERALGHWLNVMFETYVLLSEPIDGERLAPKLERVVDTNYPEEISTFITLNLQPITDIHLNPHIPRGFEAVSNPLYSHILMGIAFLILGIACINFLSLSLGGSLARAREVGVRKVVGAVKAQLVIQFMGETFIMSLTALLLGLMLAGIFLPAFNSMSGKDLSLMLDGRALIFLCGLIFVTGLAAGTYPALTLSRFQAADVLHRRPRVTGAGALVKVLVVFQFVLSIGFLICTFILGDQLRFLLEKELGYDRSLVVTVENTAAPSVSGEVVERMRTALAAEAPFSGVTAASENLVGSPTRMGFRDQDGMFKSFFQMTVDYDFLKTLDIALLEGRNFSREYGTDPSQAVIVNEALVRYFQWTSGLDQKLPGINFPEHRIIGVVEDFHFQDLRNEVSPLALVLNPRTLMQGISDINTSVSPDRYNFIYIRMQPDAMPEGLDRIKQMWELSAPGQPFRFSFLEEDIREQYREVERWRNMLGKATLFTILIACLGLFGLSSLTVARKTKEIGVRKVLGASTFRIVALLSQNFGSLVVAANLIAWPVAYFIMRRWLMDFAYRVEPQFLRFFTAAILALAVALLTVAYHSIRAALTDPVKTIRYE